MMTESQDKSPNTRRILLLTHRIPYPPDKGDRIRSYHLLTYLARHGSVDLATLVDEEVADASRSALEGLCRRVLLAPLSRTGRWFRAACSLTCGRSATAGLFHSRLLRRTVDAWLADTDYDVIVCFSSGVLPYVLHRGLGPRLIADLVDVDSQKWFDYAARTSAANPLSWMFRLEGKRLRELECAASEARATVLITEVEAAVYRAFCPEASVHVVANGVDLDHFRAMPATDDGSCVFVGYLDYRANVLGLEWFCREIWPAVHAERPSATFHIVGRNAVPAVLRLGAIPGVRVVGPVPDVRPYMARARIVLVPLPVARGVQNKVLEALAMGKAVLGSPAALEGLAITPGVEACQAETPAEWRATLVGLWDDAEGRRDLGDRGRQFVELHHNWESCLEPFGALLVGSGDQTGWQVPAADSVVQTQ
jgi:sugar transferase (PEP-CTERM/EpsH1 system associated)